VRQNDTVEHTIAIEVGLKGRLRRRSQQANRGYGGHNTTDETSEHPDACSQWFSRNLTSAVVL
jgi:hypothetical protein